MDIFQSFCASGACREAKLKGWRCDFIYVRRSKNQVAVLTRIAEALSGMRTSE